MERLGLSEEELLQALDAEPLAILGDDLADKPQLPILLTLTEAALERVHPDALRRWVRTTGPAGRPLDLLLARDYGGFEDAVTTLVERGFVIGGR